MPSIGFGLANAGNGLTNREATRLRMLRAAHLRADLRVDKLDATLDRAAADLKLLPGAGLEAALFLSAKDDAAAAIELSAFAKGIATRRIPVARYLILHRDEVSTTRRWIDLARQHLPKGAQIGGGADQNFAELNRARPDPKAMDFLAYPINPQVHAFDDMSILENAAGQGGTVVTAARFGNGKPVVASPVTLKPRAGGADPRQSSLLAAAWTVASFKSLADGGASSVTYFETHGGAGLLDGDVVFPMFHVFASLAGYQTVEPALCDQPEDVAALLLRDAKAGRRLILANLTNEVRVVDFRAVKLVTPVRAQILDSESLGRLGRAPEQFQTAPAWELRGSRHEVALMPYAVAVLTA